MLTLKINTINPVTLFCLYLAYLVLIPYKTTIFYWVYLNVAKVGGLQRQGVKGEAVVIYRKPLTTPVLKPSGFPEG